MIANYIFGVYILQQRTSLSTPYKLQYRQKHRKYSNTIFFPMPIRRATQIRLKFMH